MTDKNPNARPLPRNGDFLRRSLLFNQRVPGAAQQCSCLHGSRACLDDGLGDVFWSLKCTAHKNAFSGSSDGSKGSCFTKPPIREINPQAVGHFLCLRGSFQTYRKDNEIKGLLHHMAFFGHIGNQKITVFTACIHGGNPGADKAYPMFDFCIFVIFFKILSMSTHVHEKDGAIQIMAGVFLGDDRLFDSVHATDRGTVSVVAAV